MLNKMKLCMNDYIIMEEKLCEITEKKNIEFKYYNIYDRFFDFSGSTIALAFSCVSRDIF